jgi:Outer membrane protein beta-barrel domain
MSLRIVVLMGLILAGFTGFAQDSQEGEKKKKKDFRPDIPGSILLELGVNQKNGLTPPDFQKGFWGSRTFNVYYQYSFRLFKSSFSLNPGIGLSLERWKFTNEYTLPSQPIVDGTYPLVPASNFVPGSINRSQLINNYLEMPIDIRWDSHPEDIARSFNVALGGRFGVLYDSFTKIDYSENGENKSIKEKQWHGMNPTRYAVYGRIGIGGFSIFAYFNLSPMWQTNKGPLGTTMSSSTIGISINGF